MSAPFDFPDTPEQSASLYVGRTWQLEQIKLSIGLPTACCSHYPLIFGAPLTGKTGLIHALRSQLQPYIQLHLINVRHDIGQDEANFYRYLADTLIARFNMQHELQASDVFDGETFQKLLRALHPRVTTVIVFERLMYLSNEILRGFADILRGIFDMRNETNNEAFQHFCFILTGGIELYKAVYGTGDSPLKGVSKVFNMDDLSQQESNFLLLHQFGQKGLELISQKSRILHRIYDQVHGHPYLSLLLADKLIQHKQARRHVRLSLETIIDGLINEHHVISSMLEKTKRYQLDDTLREIFFNSGGYYWYGDKVEELNLIGLIRKDQDGRMCLIRNRVYERALEREFGPSSLSFPLHNTSPLPPTNTNVKKDYCVVQLTKLKDSYNIRVTDSSTNTSRSVEVSLPFTPDEMRVIFKALYPPFANREFTPQQIAVLQRLDMWNADAKRPVVHAVEIVGERLHNILMSDHVGEVFNNVLRGAGQNQTYVALQLRFDVHATEAAHYPWELIRDHLHDNLVLTGKVELSRYMNEIEQKIIPAFMPPLRILYICAHPINMESLPDTELQYVLEVLKIPQDQQRVELIQMIRQSSNPSPASSTQLPTFENVKEYLRQYHVDVLHFDGHGSFGYLCPNCSQVNRSNLGRCQVCQRDISDVGPSGYLYFEDINGNKDRIKAEDVSTAIARYNIRLAVLSSCYGATVEGETLFPGMAQSLIKQGVAAVISPQLPVSPQGAADFAHAFYQSLTARDTEGELLTALNRGRDNLQRNSNHEWFVYTLYTSVMHGTFNLFQ